jgi:hypothetical protein
MRIHDVGPRTEVVYPAPKGTSWSWEATSRWGSRPVREFDKGIGHGWAMVKGFFRLVRTRARNTVRDGT